MVKISRIGDIFIFNSSHGHHPKRSVQSISYLLACQRSKTVLSGLQTTDARGHPVETAAGVVGWWCSGSVEGLETGICKANQ